MPVTEFFASQNTSEGFQSRFDSVFSEDRLQRLFVVQGGPGTGKSHLMKQIAACWEADGRRVERFLCSSDPDSLDGVADWQRGIAVIDGTPPHTKECRYPGCVSNLWNTGEFWDSSRLQSQREAISELCRQKSRAYTDAYAYLRAAGQMSTARQRPALQGLDKEKLSAAARRFCAKELSGRGDGKREIRLIRSYTKQGYHSLRSLEALAERRCLICDNYGVGSLFLEAILQECTLDCICSYSPLSPRSLDALYFSQKSLCLVCDRKEVWEKEFSQADRYVNMERFLSADSLRSHRQKLRFAAKCQSSLEQGAAEALQKASQLHRRLEEIYSSAMNFSAFSQYERRLVDQLR